MLKYISLKISLISIISFLSSCDPGTQYINSITNNSSYEVRLIANPGLFFDTIVIQKYEKYELINSISLGNLKQHQPKFETCESGFNYIKQIEFLNGEEIIGIYLPNVSDWKYKILDNPTSKYGCACELILTDKFVSK